MVQNFFLSWARWVDQTNPFPTTKLPIRRKFSCLDENELRLIFILFKWFSIFNLCGLNKETNNHLHFMRFNSTNTISTPFSKPITKSFEVYLLWHLIKFRIHESYDQACKGWNNHEYKIAHLRNILNIFFAENISLFVK